jgi:hypothetical protein
VSTLTRDFVADIEIRSDGTGRTVHGILVPYGQVARVSDGGPAYEEEFASGAFARDIAARAGDFRGVKLLLQHDHRDPIGRAVDLRDDAAGLYGAFRVSNIARGEEALELLRDGVLDSFSIGFRALHSTRRGTVTVRERAGLRESSLVTFPAYAGALVAGVRALYAGALVAGVRALDDDDFPPAEEGPVATTADDGQRTEQPPASDPATAHEPPATPSGLTPSQRRERLRPNLKENAR